MGKRSVGFIGPAPGTSAAAIYSFPYLPEHGWACAEGIAFGVNLLGEEEHGPEEAERDHAQIAGRVAKAGQVGIWKMWLGWAGPGAHFYGSSAYDGSGTGGHLKSVIDDGDGSVFDDRGSGIGCPFNRQKGFGRGDGPYGVTIHEHKVL